MKNYIKLGFIAVGFAAAIGLNIYVDKLQAQTPILPAQPLPELILKVSPSELDLISEGLQTQPFGKVVPLINKLRQQIVDQQPKPVEAPKVETPK